jgi:hypothetical protein
MTMAAPVITTMTTSRIRLVPELNQPRIRRPAYTMVLTLFGFRAPMHRNPA